jgi:hypothetical protein
LANSVALHFAWTTIRFGQALTGDTNGEFVDEQLAGALIAQVTDGTAPLSSISPELFDLLRIPVTVMVADGVAGKVLNTKYCDLHRAF